MTATILIVAFGLFLLLLLLYLVRRRAADISDYASLAGRLQQVPVAALLNLIDPAQQIYLERMLPKSEFARLQRTRNRALLGYTRAIYRNAGILVQCAHAATHSERPEIAEAGRELLDLALFARMQSLRALFVLAFSLAVPTPAADLLPVITKYVTATSRSTSIAALLIQSSVTA